jgi:hypothetical protein
MVSMMIPVAWFTNSQFGLEKSAQDEFAAAIRTGNCQVITD